MKKHILFIFLILSMVLFYENYNSLALDQVLSDQIKGKFDKEITLDLRDMDIIDVFKFLSLKGDFSIVVSKAVTGRVTLVLKNVKIGDALDIIAISNGLGYRAMENIVYVMPEDEYFQTYGKFFRDKNKVKIVYLQYVKPSYALETLKNIKSEIGKIIIVEDTGTVVMVDTDERLLEMTEVLEKIDHKLETRIYNLDYAKAEMVKEQLRERLDVKSVGSIQADMRSNQIIISALPDRFPEVEAIVQALDKKTKEVLIKVKILKVIFNPKYDFGIDWQRAFSGSANKILRSLVFRGAFPISSAVSTAADIGTVGQIGVGNLSDNEFTIEIKALKQVSDTKVLANPQILVTNNEEAQVFIGDKLAYVTTTTTGTGADQTTNEEIHFLDVGVQLDVKPTISDDGYIRMAIKPEISSKSGELTTTQGAKVPLVNTTFIESNVMVKDGETIVIGGLHKDETSQVKKGIPLLMDIPYLGAMFRNDSDSVTKTEIVIFLTPYITEGNKTLVEDVPSYQPKMAPMKDY